MSKRFFVIIGFCSLAIISCGQQQHSTAATETETRAIAFPGAEGFGKYATGGRGGKVYIVTNLNDNGPGSFREAAEANEPRIIVFAVSGTIHLDNTVSIKGNATIAGQSAPGDGICIADKSVQVAGDNIVVRYMRFRLGDKWQRQKGMVDGSGGEDAFGGNRRNHGSKGSFLKSRADIQEAELLANKKPGSGEWGMEPGNERGLLHTEKDGKIVREHIPTFAGNYNLYYDGIYNAIRKNAQAPVTGQDGLNIIKIIEAAFESNKQGKTIAI